MQAIETRYLPCTNSRGSRVKALCDAGTVTVPWDHALDCDGNHDAAARALVSKLGWSGRRWHRGALKASRGRVYVCSYLTELLDT